MRRKLTIENVILKKVRIGSGKKLMAILYKCYFTFYKAEYELRFRLRDSEVSSTVMDMYFPTHALPVMTFNIFLDKKKLKLLNNVSDDIFLCSKKVVNKPTILYLREQLPDFISKIKNFIIADVAL